MPNLVALRATIFPLSVKNRWGAPGRRRTQVKVSHVRTEIDVRKRSFIVCCVGPWNALPHEVVAGELRCI